MQKVYLIRHGHPDIPLGERWCVGGRSDFPLGALGRLQAALLPFVPELQGLDAVFCSSLIRARETALPLCRSPREMPGIQEQDMGVWDGLSFREIRHGVADQPDLTAHNSSPKNSSNKAAASCRRRWA